MYKILLLLITGLSFNACENHENKERYEISIGDQVEIYYSTNSCCYYCIANEQDLKHIAFVNKKMIDSGPKDCDGCNYKSAFIFEGKSLGIDTVKLRLSLAAEACNENNIHEEIYVVEIK